MNKYLVIAIDYFSQWVEAYTLPLKGITTVAEAPIKYWICRFGVSLWKMHSDKSRYLSQRHLKMSAKI